MKKQVRTTNRAFVPQVKMLIIVGIIKFLFSSDCLYHPLIEQPVVFDFSTDEITVKAYWKRGFRVNYMVSRSCII